MGYRLNRLDEPVFIAVSKPLLTEFGIHYKLESCGEERELNSGMCYVMHGDNIDVKCQYLKVMGKRRTQQKSMKRKSHTAVSSRPNGEDHGSTNFFESSVRLFPGKLATTIQFIN